MRDGVQSLDPFMDNDGLVRVGGRLRRSVLPNEVKHPIIIPKESTTSELIVRWCHQKVAHAGRGMTLNEIRTSGFWVVNGNSKVRHVIHKCILCRRLRGRLCEQKMADLPRDRTTPAPPFTYCGVDAFGPFMIKEGRKETEEIWHYVHLFNI